MPIPRTESDEELSPVERVRRLARRATTTTSVEAQAAGRRGRRRRATFLERLRRNVANALRRVARRQTRG